MPAPPDDALFDRAVLYWNAREPHAAHEDWETLWHEAEGTRRDWLQGLIQVAAALFHLERGYYATGFVKLMRSAAPKRRAHDARGERIDAERLESALQAWERHAERVERGAPLAEDPPAWPTIHYRPGVRPEPLQPEDRAGPREGAAG